MIESLIFLGDWQQHVKKQVMDALEVLFSPDPNRVTIRFVRHSPGRRRNAETTMYDIATTSKSDSLAVRSAFAKYRHKESPVVRPAELKDINVFPLVIMLKFSIVSQ